MVDYDGETFCAVNDEGVLSPDPDQQPVDALLRQRIFGNNEYLLEGKNGVSCAFVAGETPTFDGSPYYGARPWASVDWTCPIIIPLWWEPGDLGVDLGIHADFNGAFQGISSYDLKVVLMDGNQDIIGTSDIETASGLDILEYEEQNHAVITAEMQTPYSGPPHYGSVQLWIRSEQIDDLQSTFTPEDGLAARILNLESVGSTYINNELAPPYPEYGKPSVGYVKTAGQESSADIIGFVTPSDGSGGNTGQVWIDRSIGPSFVLGVADDIETHPLSYIQCRSATIRKFRSPASVTSLTRGQLQAGQAETGVVAAKQATRSVRAYDRRRLIAWGPPGYSPPENEESQTGDNFPVRWRTSRADSADRETYLADDTIMIRRESPTLELRAFVIAGLHKAINTSDPGSAEFDFIWELQSITGANTTWATAGVVEYTKTERVTVPVFPTMGASWKEDAQRYLLQREYVLRGRGGLGVGDDWPYCFKDGQLWGEDLPLLTMISVDIPVDSLTVADLATPLRSLLKCEYVDNSLAGYAYTQTTGAQLGYDLECTVIGYSIHQRGPNVD